MLVECSAAPGGQLQSYHKASKAPVFSFPETAFDEFRTRVLSFWFYADYRRVKEHKTFQELYGFAQRPVNFFDGTQVIQQVGDTFPCNSCGIVMPISHTTIDHQKPQAGGENLAVAKLFRAMGLTVDGPKGVKGKLFASMPDYVTTVKFIMSSRSAPLIAPHARATAADGGKPARQTLNDAGALMFSMLYHAGDLADLQDKAMHCILNLKPLCIRCNTSKGNTILG